MRKYELVTVFTVEEELYNAGIEKLRTILSEFKAKVVSEESMGDKTLAYEIKKNKKGRYTLFIVEAEPSVIVEIDRQFKLIPSLFTFMFVKVEE